MAFALADRVKFTTTTTGTGTITVAAAVAGYVTPAGSGQLSDADVVPIFIEGAAGAWEHSLATLGSTQTTLTRVLRKSSTGSLLNLSGTSTVFIDPGAADLAGWVRVAAGSGTAVPNIDIVDSMDAFDVYKLVVTGLTVAASDVLYLRMRIGGTWITANSSYSFHVDSSAAASALYSGENGTSDRGIRLSSTQSTNALAESCFEFTLWNPSNTAFEKRVTWTGTTGTGVSGAIAKSSGVGVCYTSAAACTGIRFCQDGGGNISIISAVLYGLKK